MERNGVFFCLKETLKSSFLINVSSYLLTQTPHYPLICPHLDLDKKNICNDYIQKDYLILSLCHNTAVSYSLWLPQ